MSVISDAILQSLGGNAFLFDAGVSSTIPGRNNLTFTIGRGTRVDGKAASHCCIEQKPSGEFEMRFFFLVPRKQIVKRIASTMVGDIADLRATFMRMAINPDARLVA